MYNYVVAAKSSVSIKRPVWLFHCVDKSDILPQSMELRIVTWLVVSLIGGC